MTEVEMITSTMLEDMSDIQNKYRIPSDKFSKGIEFAIACKEYKSSTKAYRSVYGASKTPVEARRFLHLAWVEAIVRRFSAGDYIRYYGLRARIIEEMASLALDEDVADKNKIEAAKVFLDNTKMPENTTVDINIDVTDEAKKSLDRLFDGLQQLVDGNKMITPSGEIVEVEYIQ